MGAIAVCEGRLLLVRRAHEPGAGRWSVPGGRVERGETLTAAVERELAEETGVVAECGDLLGCVERIDEDHHFVILDFAVSVPSPAPEARAGDDADEAAWVPLAEVPTLALVDGLADFLADHGVLPSAPSTPGRASR